jgi:hypothetical protein
MEWSVHHRQGRRKPKSKIEKEWAWLRSYCKWQSTVLGYAIEIDASRGPRTQLVCTRFLGTEENRWLELTLGAVERIKN